MDDGGIVTAQEEMEKEAIKFYKNLFTVDVDTRPERVTDAIPSKVKC